MARAQPSLLTRFLRRIGNTTVPTADSDPELLRRFAGERDEAAFTALVQRHGPMVLSVCRRVLPAEADAEDAFQATFLVLIRRAGSLRQPESLANWLYGVAYRTALEARTRAAKRRAKERQVMHPAPPEPTAAVAWADLRPVLDAEVSRLPDKYRAPFVLCYFEGRTNDEAAQLLGCPKGTVLSRLAWARERLQSRLTRRGLTLSGAALGVVLTEQAAAMPTALTGSTVQAALLFAASKTSAVAPEVAVLTERVLRTMLLDNVRKATTVLLLASALAAGGLLAYRGWATAPPATTLRASGLNPEARGDGMVEWKERASLDGKAGAVFAVAFSPDGKTLAAGYGKGPNLGAVKLWDVTTGREKATLRADTRLPDTPKLPLSVVESVAFSRDGSLLLAQTTTNRQSAILWDARSGMQLPPREAYVLDTRPVVLGPDSKTVAGAKTSWKENPAGQVFVDKVEIKVWDAATGNEHASTPAHGRLVSTLAFAPDGRTIAWADDALRLWDFSTDRQRVLRKKKEWVSRATFSPQGKLLAAATWDAGSKRASVRLWEVATGKELLCLGGFSGQVSGVAFSPDGTTLATVGEDRTIRIWSLARGDERARMHGHTDWILTVAFGPDGRTLATGSQDGTIKLWEVTRQP
jgi:RNA polymerase sigma factor (sigma-70 family)